MDIKFKNEQMDMIRFGAFPSVNPAIKSKNDQNFSENREESELCIACARGNFDRVKEVIDQGADINKKDSANLSPIMRAASNGHRDIVELLVSRGAKISYDVLCSVKTKINLLEENAKAGSGDPYAVAIWKNFLEYLIQEGKKQ